MFNALYFVFIKTELNSVQELPSDEDIQKIEFLI